jgi:hypothetical protein
MTERERLIELITDCDYWGPIRIADHLLSNGVIVPPCKVGDRAYYLTTEDTEKELNVTDIFCGYVQSLAFDGYQVWIAVKYINGLYYHHRQQDVGKSLFFTKEEAEKALKERSEGK